MEKMTRNVSFCLLRHLYLNGGKRTFLTGRPAFGKIVSASEHEATGHQDILLQNMKSSTDTSEILFSVKKHHVIMNDRHIMQAFKSIFMLQKSDNSDLSNGEVMRSNEFKTLCRILNKRIQSLDVEDAIDCLKTLSYVGVPTTSKIVQSLLQFVTKEVNHLGLEQITFLDFLIKDFDSCPLVDALKIALPIVFEAQLKLKIEYDNITQLTGLLYYCSRKNTSVETTDFVIDNVMKCRDQIDVKNAKSVIKSICDLREVDESVRPLLHHALDILVENSNECSFHDFDSILSKITSKYSTKNYFFYHEDFVNAAVKFVLRTDAGFEEGIWILRKAAKFSHVDLKLLEYLAQKAELSNLRSCGTLMLFTFVSGFAQADIKPNNWATLEPEILQNALNHINHIELPWVKFTKDLCTLDCWPVEIFERIFQPQFLEKYLSRDYNTLDYVQLLSLHQAVSAFCPWYTGPQPSQMVIDRAIDLMNIKKYEASPLKPFLIRGLGGERYLLSGVHTRMGHFIDHVVMMRKGGHPVAVGQFETKKEQKLFLEEILPHFDDCQTIVILLVPPSSYTTNAERLKGPFRLDISSFEALYPSSVVAISTTSWNQLLEQEKLPYIMQAIKLKCEIDDE